MVTPWQAQFPISNNVPGPANEPHLVVGSVVVVWVEVVVVGIVFVDALSQEEFSIVMIISIINSNNDNVLLILIYP